MRKFILYTIALCIVFTAIDVWAQLPVRRYRIFDVSGNLVTNQNIHIKISLKIASTIEYEEIHYPVTVQADGTAFIDLFGGRVTYRNSSSNIDWGNVDKTFDIKADIDGLSGVGDFPITVQNDIKIEMVAYAKFAEVALSSTSTGTATTVANASIVNASVAAGAAIDGTKISPNFGGQAISTSGNSTVGGDLAVGGNSTLGNAAGDITNVNGSLRVYDIDLSHYTDIKGGNQIVNLNFILPETAGTTGNVLTTNGSGVLSWTNNIEANTIVYEGATADAFETTVGVIDPTADRTINFPDASGTVLLSDGSGNTSIGGNLTVNGNANLGDDAANDIVNLKAKMRVYDSDNSNYTQLAGPNGALQTANLDFIFPITMGSSGNILSTDGIGNLSWTSTPNVSSILFDGATADVNKTTIGVIDPTASRNINFPNASGTVVLLDGSGNLILSDNLNVNGNSNLGNDASDVTSLKGVFRIYDTDYSNYTQLAGPNGVSQTTNLFFTFPINAGSNGSLLSTDGSGNLSWTTNLSGANVTASGDLSVGGNTSLGDASSDITSLKGKLRVFDTDNSNYTDIVGPNGASQTANLTFTLPVNAGSSGNMLITDGSGNLSWSSSVTASGNLNVAGNSSLGDAAGDITSLKGKLRVYDSDTSNYTDIVGPDGTSQTANLLFTLPTNSGTSGQVLSTDGSGNLSWNNAAGTLDALTDAKSGGANFSNSLIIGHEHTGTLNNAQGNIGVGSGTLYNISSGIFNTSIGFNSLNQITSGTGNIGIGSYAGASLTNQLMSIAIGYTSMYQATSDQSIAIGYESGYSSTGNQNTLLGNRIFRSYQSGNYNVVIGTDAMYNGSYDAAGSGAANGSVNANTIVGHQAFLNSFNGDNNVAVGYQSLYNNKNGEKNTVIGYQSGYRITGSGNITIGANAGPTSGGGLAASNNLLFIDNAETDNPLILGNFSTDLLTVNGSLLSTGEMTVAKQGNGEGGQINLKAVDNAGAAEAGDWHIDQFSTSGDSRFRIFYGTDLEKGISISNTGNTGIYNQLRYYEPNASANGNHYTAFIAQSQTANVTYTLPAADGTSGQYLKTDGAGNLSWAAGGSGSDAISLQSRTVSSTAPSNGDALVWNGSAWEPASATSSIQKLMLSEGTSLDIDALRGGGTRIDNVNISAHAFFRMINAGTGSDITGLQNGENGRIVYLLNTSGSNMNFKEENTNSTAINRLILGVSNKTIGINGVIVFIYSTTINRWVMISST